MIDAQALNRPAGDLEEPLPVDHELGGQIAEPFEMASRVGPAGKAHEGYGGNAEVGVVDGVRVADHAVAEAIRGARELDRHHGLLLPRVEPALHRGRRAVDAGSQHRARHRLADDPFQKVVRDDPLVVPAHDPLRLVEDLLTLHLCLLGDVVDDLVVKVDEQQMKLRDDEVLVVSGVTDQGPALAVSRQVDARSLAAYGIAVDEQLQATVGRARPVIQKRLVLGT